jgi:diketogulonate reductase-like aldo/keto reductase
VDLRFLTRSPGLFTIPKAARPEHVRDNSGASDFTLEDADVELLDRPFPAPSAPVPLAMD